jgi:20S proteasome alpha/beta subunit
VTQIVGIICKDAIVIGCESQYTMGGSKQFERQKIDRFVFKDGSDGVVAFAGAVGPALRTIDLMKEIAVKVEPDKDRSGAEIAREAVLKFRREVMAVYQKTPSTMSVQEQDYLFADSEDYGFALLVGYAFKNPRHVSTQPAKILRLYRVDLADGRPERIKKYDVPGSGQNLAAFALEQFDCSRLTWKEAVPLMVDALERIKTIDLYCGGTVRVAVLEPELHPKVRVAFLDDFTQRIIEKLKALRKANAEWQQKKYRELIEEIHAEDYAAIMRELRDEEDQHRQWHEQYGGVEVYRPKQPPSKSPKTSNGQSGEPAK